MSQLPHRTGPIVRTLAGFHANATGRELRHKGQELGAGEFLAHHNIALVIDTVQLKDIFCQIDPEYRYLHGWTLLQAFNTQRLTVLLRECSSKMGESIPLIRGSAGRG
jgi:hypothetical protein